MKLTTENYYTKEADEKYMSVSQFNAFEKCEVKALKKYKGELEDEKVSAFIEGNYMHTMFESPKAHTDFIKEHEEDIFTKTAPKRKKAEFVKADEAYGLAKNHRRFVQAMEGESEQIYTFKLFDVDWKIRVDKINHDKVFFSDLKYVKSIEDELWKTYYLDDYGNTVRDSAYHQAVTDGFSDTYIKKNMKVTFYEFWGYWRRFSLYSMGISLAMEKEYTALMTVISKEKIPDFDVFIFDDSNRMSDELIDIERYMPRIISLKAGKEKPVGCGVCNICRKSKKIDRLRHAVSIF